LDRRNVAHVPAGEPRLRLGANSDGGLRFSAEKGSKGNRSEPRIQNSEVRSRESPALPG
jgi:hypothetical protein